MAFALHAMMLQQVHQAKALKDLHEGVHDLAVLQDGQPVLAPTKPGGKRRCKRPWDGWPRDGGCSSGDGECTTPSPGGGPGGEYFILFCYAGSQWYPKHQWKSGFLNLWVSRGEPCITGFLPSSFAYINRQCSLRYRRMSQLVRHLLLWSQKHLRLLYAIHILGMFNQVANELSWVALPGEYRLQSQAVQLIWIRFRVAQVDLFASPEIAHCQWFYSLSEETLGTDALAHSWPQDLHKYAFPSVSLLAQTLCKLREEEEQVLLVAPYWPTGPVSRNSWSSQQPLPGWFLWGRICFLRDVAPFGTRIQTCGNSMCGPCGPWTKVLGDLARPQDGPMRWSWTCSSNGVPLTVRTPRDVWSEPC